MNFKNFWGRIEIWKIFGVKRYFGNVGGLWTHGLGGFLIEVGLQEFGWGIFRRGLGFNCMRVLAFLELG